MTSGPCSSSADAATGLPFASFKHEARGLVARPEGTRGGTGDDLLGGRAVHGLDHETGHVVGRFTCPKSALKASSLACRDVAFLPTLVLAIEFVAISMENTGLARQPGRGDKPIPCGNSYLAGKRMDRLAAMETFVRIESTACAPGSPSALAPPITSVWLR
jgi:hypothetical protein